MKKGMDAKQKAKTETIPYSISAYAVMLTLVSFLGFLIENTWIVLTEGFVDNRNMNAPFLIGYGVISGAHCLGDNGFAPTETECRLAEVRSRSMSCNCMTRTS